MKDDLLREVERRKEWIVEGITSFSESGNFRSFPWREKGVSPYKILIAEIALKRTTAMAASKLYIKVIEAYPDVYGIYEAEENELISILSSIGLQRQRAKSLKNLSKYLVENNRGEIPGTLEELLVVPGIGAYSARAILSLGFDKPYAVVDSNVIRIVYRIFNSNIAKYPSQSFCQSIVDKIFDEKDHRKFNLAILDIGAMICMPARPKCELCPLNSCCDFFISGRWKIEIMDRNAKKVALIRKRKGLSQVQLARAAGISKQTLIGFEKGRTQPKEKTLEHLAEALGVEVEELRDN